MKDKIIQHYIEAWNVKDGEKRMQLLKRSFDKNGRYTDPHIPQRVEDIQQMDAVIEAFNSRLPHQLKLIGEVEFHSYVFRLKWRMEDNGSVLSNGIFVGEFGTGDLITNIICFIG